MAVNIEKQSFIDALKEDAINFKQIPLEVLSSYDYMLTAVSINGDNLQYASEELRGNEELVIAAIKNKASAIKYASLELQYNRDVVLEAVKANPRLLSTKYDLIKRVFYFDKEILLTAINGGADTFKFTSDRLKDDKDIVLAAVQRDFDAIEYASERLRNDEDFVLAAKLAEESYWDIVFDDFDDDLFDEIWKKN